MNVVVNVDVITPSTPNTAISTNESMSHSTSVPSATVTVTAVGMDINLKEIINKRHSNVVMKNDVVDLIRKYSSMNPNSYQGMEIAQKIFDSTGYCVGPLIKKGNNLSNQIDDLTIAPTSTAAPYSPDHLIRHGSRSSGLSNNSILTGNINGSRSKQRRHSSHLLLGYKNAIANANNNNSSGGNGNGIKQFNASERAHTLKNMSAGSNQNETQRLSNAGSFNGDEIEKSSSFTSSSKMKRGVLREFGIEDIDNLLSPSMSGGSVQQQQRGRDAGADSVKIVGVDVVSHYIDKQVGHSTHMKYVIRTRISFTPDLGDLDPGRKELVVTVSRRYNDFRSLHKLLLSNYTNESCFSFINESSSLPKLPSPSWRRILSESYASNFGNGLNKYLKDIIAFQPTNLLGSMMQPLSSNPHLIEFLTKGAIRGRIQELSGVEWELVPLSSITSSIDNEDLSRLSLGSITEPRDFGSRTSSATSTASYMDIDDVDFEKSLFQVRGGGRCVRRIPAEDGGLHISLVLESRSDTVILESHNFFVNGLIEQDFRCAACACDIGMASADTGVFSSSSTTSTASSIHRDSFIDAAVINAHSSHFDKKSARFCHYTERWVCPSCFYGDLPIDPSNILATSRLIPTRIIHHWDFRLYPVCALAREFLDRIFEHPLICVSAYCPSMFSRIKPLAHARFLRLQLMNSREFLEASSLISASHAELIAPSKSICRNVISDALGENKMHLALSTELYSMQDLVDLSTKNGYSSNNSRLIQLLTDAVNIAATHMTSECFICHSRGVTCMICNKTDDILFPFQIMTTASCRKCLQLYHASCFKGEDSCPVCLENSGSRKVSDSSSSITA